MILKACIRLRLLHNNVQEYDGQDVNRHFYSYLKVFMFVVVLGIVVVISVRIVLAKYEVKDSLELVLGQAVEVVLVLDRLDEHLE